MTLSVCMVVDDQDLLARLLYYTVRSTILHAS